MQTKESIITMAFVGARNVVAVALVAFVGSTAAAGSLWATGNLDAVVTEACHAVAAPQPQAQVALPQVVLVPVAFQPIFQSPSASPMARWSSRSAFDRDPVVVTTGVRED